MKILQFDEDKISVNELVFDFSSIKYSKGLLEKAYELKEKQDLAVLTTITMLESCKNKAHIIDILVSKLQALPYDKEFDTSELPETVKVFTNLGNDREPDYFELEITKDKVLPFLKQNPAFSFSNNNFDSVYQEFILETI